MATTLHDLLQPQVILDVVSRIRRGRGRLGQFFGFHAKAYDGVMMKGPNTKTSPTRTGSYRIFDNTRTAAEGRAPGTGPATVKPNPIGEVAYACIRWHEKIRLLAEELGQLSKVIGPNSVVDAAGQDYVTRQTAFLAQRINNAVELATWGMIRGTLYLKSDGERWIPTLTQPAAGTPTVTIDFQIPAANKTQLNMLGGGNLVTSTWANAATNIIDQVVNIDAAFVQLTGDSLKHIWLNGNTWLNVINNNQVRNTAGSANTPYQTYERVKETGFDGEEISEYTAVIRGYPHVVWHIINDVLVSDGGDDPSYSAGTGTLTKAIPDNIAVFMPEVSPDWVDFLHCGEHVSEQPGQPMVLREGYHFWSEWVTQPTSVELIGLFNGIPRLSRPKNIAYGTVVF